MKKFKKFNISKGLIIKNEKILLIKRSKPPYREKWSLPGGKLENNEFAKSACIREIEEETGLKTKEIKLVGIVNEFLTEIKNYYQFTIWVYQIIPFSFLTKNCKEIDFFNLKAFLHSKKNKFNAADSFFTKLFLFKKDKKKLIIELKTKLEKNRHIIKEKLLY